MTRFEKPSHSSYLPTYEDGKERVFRNVGINNADAKGITRNKAYKSFLIPRNNTPPDV